MRSSDRKDLACERLPAVVAGVVVVALMTAFGCDRSKETRPGDAGAGNGAADVPSSVPDGSPLPQRTAVHPLLGKAEDAVLPADKSIPSTATPEHERVIHLVRDTGRKAPRLPVLTIDYPLDESIFPPEIVPPTFLWHDVSGSADTWLVTVTFADEADISVLVPGAAPPVGKIDPACVTKSNTYRPTPYQASARSWTPARTVWQAIKKRSVEAPATVTILGFASAAPKRVLSRGRTTLTTSKDPVGAPVFYRDVPLMPSETAEGKIKPLSHDALPMITWRLRDISRSDSRVVMSDMPTCANCHSFSADGKTLGMDIDGPSGDKGVYALAPITQKMVLEDKDTITWNSFTGKPKGHHTIGFLSQVSPDGLYAVTTLNEALYVRNFMDYKFLQVFYPTRGILAYHSRQTGEIKALPGADNPAYVHCDPAWSPDGKYLVFARAKARDPYPGDSRKASRPNDPRETRIQYDLYRIPFNGGAGGTAVAIEGASENGMSNTFPKVSPDGKWVVFVKCKNGQLMRPDGRLWIVPTAGGEAREMRCNTDLMNSWHSFSPNGRWMVFASKSRSPFTQLFLSHIDADGKDSPAIYLPNSTAANRAANIPEFINIAYSALETIEAPVVQYRRDLREAAALLRQQRFAEAEAKFKLVIKKRPDLYKAHLGIGLSLLELGRYPEAMGHFGQGLKSNAKTPIPREGLAILHDCLGKTLSRTGKHVKAIEHFEQALALHPTLDHARYNWGNALLALGRPAEAIEQFRRALAVNTKYYKAHVGIGNALMALRRFEDAGREYKQALNLRPSSVDAHLALGRAFLAQGKPDRAIPPLAKAVEIRPGIAELHLALGGGIPCGKAVQGLRRAVPQGHRQRPERPARAEPSGGASGHLPQAGRPQGPCAAGHPGRDLCRDRTLRRRRRGGHPGTGHAHGPPGVTGPAHSAAAGTLQGQTAVPGTVRPTIHPGDQARHPTKKAGDPFGPPALNFRYHRRSYLFRRRLSKPTPASATRLSVTGSGITVSPKPVPSAWARIVAALRVVSHMARSSIQESVAPGV